MGRIDIVVFPDGNSEIFGQVRSADDASLLMRVNSYVATLAPSANPRKFTGYYGAADASDIAWSEYDEANPIVMVPIAPVESGFTGDGGEFYRPMELVQAPEALRETCVL